MKVKAKRKGGAIMALLYVAVFLAAFVAGAASKFVIKPAWSKTYSVEWSEEMGTLKTDISYGDGEANKFDLYLPKDASKESYGLAVYFHAGGFTAGDKSDDRNMLAWLCSKGYVAAGINYTLRNDANNASVLTQSNEIKAAIPKVIEAAAEYGYHVNKMTVAGGSAGHALAMIRYICNNVECSHKTFQLEYKYNACKPGAHERIIEMAMNGSGTRDTGRALHISKDTVTAVLKKRKNSSFRSTRSFSPNTRELILKFTTR